MVTRIRTVIILLLALTALLLAACAPGTATNSEGDDIAVDGHAEEAVDAHDGADETDGHGDADHGDAHDEAGEVLDGAKEIRIVANEWGFEPETLHLHEGEAVNIVLVNEGVVEHEVEFEAFDFHLHAEAGETVAAGFVPEHTGDFEFGCFVPGHYEAGMVGTLKVEPSHS